MIMFRLSLFLILILLITTAGFPLSAYAADPLVPCGREGTPNCTLCHVFVLADNLIDLVIFNLVPIVAGLMLAVGAVIFISAGASQKWVKTGQTILKNTLIGVIIVYASFLIISSILYAIASPLGGVDATFGISQGGFKFECSAPPPPPPPPTGEVLPPPPIPGSGSTARIDTPDSAGNPYTDGYQMNTEAMKKLLAENNDLETIGLEMTQPGSGTVNISYLLSKEARDSGIPSNLLAAIIQVESSGNPNAFSTDRDGVTNYGLMQVRSDTARRFDSNLSGLTDAQIGARLLDPNYNIRIGTAYLRDLSTKYSGDLNKIIPAYNGGPRANFSSQNCPGQARWQCGWDDNAHTIRNTGYQVTRNYVTKVRSLSGL